MNEFSANHSSKSFLANGGPGILSKAAAMSSQKGQGTSVLFQLILIILVISVPTSCKKLIEINAPQTSINQANVYAGDATAIAAVTGIYATISDQAEAPGFTGIGSISVTAGLYSDELTLHGAVTDNKLNAYYKNTLVSKPLQNYGPEYWSRLYNYIFRCNAAIEGLTASTTLTPSVKQQLLGEAIFMRAFFYFYLINLYGDAPLALTTDPAINAHLPRSSKDIVYQQIIKDLTDAQSMLSTSYLNGSLKQYAERLRPTVWAAAALLARVYLYTKDYAAAELEATKVLSQSSLFSLSVLNSAFLKNSSEAIWQLQPVKTNYNTEDALTFILPASGPTSTTVNPVYLSSQLVNSFETNDQRKTEWVSSVTTNGKTYYYPAKYKATTASANVTEYLMMFRLAELYLIRAEARAYLNNISGASADLNTVRTRAGLGGTSANDLASLLTAILNERKTELFTELGQRWFDLKRTNEVDNVMNTYASVKGTTWSTAWQLYPIPFDDIQKNPALVQNLGY